MQGKPTPLTRIYTMRKTGSQEVRGSPSPSAVHRGWLSSPFVCGAAKILTEACTVGGQSEEIKCHSISCYGAIPFQEFMCRIFSTFSLVVSSGSGFIPPKRKKKKKPKRPTTDKLQGGLTGASRNYKAPEKPKQKWLS